MPATDFETRLGRAMKALVPDEAGFSHPATSHMTTPNVAVTAVRARRHARPVVLMISGLGVAAAAAAVLVAMGGAGSDSVAPPAGQSRSGGSTTAPATACGAGLMPSSTPLALTESTNLPTSTRNGYGRVGSITVTLRNTAAACTLDRQPLMSIDSQQPGLFHLLVPASQVIARPVTIPNGSEVRYRIQFRKTGSHPGEAANIVVLVGSGPSRTTPLVRRSNTFAVAPIALVYLGVHR